MYDNRNHILDSSTILTTITKYVEKSWMGGEGGMDWQGWTHNNEKSGDSTEQVPYLKYFNVIS